MFAGAWIMNTSFSFIWLQLQSPTAPKLDPKGPKYCLFLEDCWVWPALVDIPMGATFRVSEAVFGNIWNVFPRGIAQLSERWGHSMEVLSVQKLMNAID